MGGRGRGKEMTVDRREKVIITIFLIHAKIQ